MGKAVGILILAHLFGDFYLQGDRMACEKGEVPSAMARHILLCLVAVFVCSTMLLGLRPLAAAIVSLAMSLSHFTIDALVKRRLPEGWSPWRRFSVDQALHVVACIVIAYAMREVLGVGIADGLEESQLAALAVVLSFLFAGKPVEIGVRRLLDSSRVETSPSRLSADERVVEPVRADAGSGRIIGILERMIVVFLTAVGQYSAIAFVIAAKSIARLKRLENDAVFAETYLVGTLASVASAMVGTALALTLFLGRLTLV